MAAKKTAAAKAIARVIEEQSDKADAKLMVPADLPQALQSIVSLRNGMTPEQIDAECRRVLGLQ